MSRRWRMVLVGVGLLGVGMALSRAWPIVADVTTGQTPEYPDLQPRRYALGRVVKAALGVARFAFEQQRGVKRPGGAATARSHAPKAKR